MGPPRGDCCARPAGGLGRDVARLCPGLSTAPSEPGAGSVAVALTPALQRQNWRGAIHDAEQGTGLHAYMFLDRFDATPISETYLSVGGPIPTTGAAVSEIDFIGQRNFPGSTTGPPVAGFTPASSGDYSGLTSKRFRSTHPVTVTPADFAGFNARVVIGP